MLWIIGIVLFALAVLVAYDVLQRQHTILRNFPVVGHFRYLLEMVGPELRQYIVTDNDEERPFSRDQRSWIYASAKRQNNYAGFGTDNDLETSPNYLVIRQSAFPLSSPKLQGKREDETHPIPCAKVLGESRGRVKAFRPASIVNVSAMSFGSLSGAAVEAINRGCKLAGCLQNTGEGGISAHHKHGGELIWQIGTGYFGCRAEDGTFSLEKFNANVQSNPVRAIEIKLSQGAKPGHGGILPGVKVTPLIAEARGVVSGEDCISPPGHSAFHDVDSMLDFVEHLAAESGLPVGIKSAVGMEQFWVDLADAMERGDRGVDFITIDGGEGGTGAAPPAFADHVALPFKVGFSRVYRIFAERGLQDRIVFIGSGRLGLPEVALFSFALGCDMINVAREAMLSIGCIQAQRCHTNHCPAGVATQNKWLSHGLDPTLKSVRCANYLVTLREIVMELTRACGAPHPALIGPDHFDILDDHFGTRSARDVFNYEAGWGMPSQIHQDAIREIMASSLKD